MGKISLEPHELADTVYLIHFDVSSQHSACKVGISSSGPDDHSWQDRGVERRLSFPIGRISNTTFEIDLSVARLAGGTMRSCADILPPAHIHQGVYGRKKCKHPGGLVASRAGHHVQ
jgi:hypothetical protein